MKLEASELEKKVSQHDEAINQDILPRLEKLEKVTTEFQEKVSGLTNDVVRVQTGQAELVKGQKDLELTMVKEGQANREVIKETKDVANKLLDHVLRVDEKEKDTEAEIVRKKAEAEEIRANEQLKSDSEIRKARWEMAGKILTGVLGAGGIITLIVQQFM